MEEDAQDDKQRNPRCQLIYVTLAAIIASIGGILFGYDIGITSGALLLLRDEFNLSCFKQEIVVTSVLIGALCASFVGGNLVDKYGRRMSILLSCGLFIVGGLILGFAVDLAMLIAGRFIVGIGVSLSVTAECAYISEISPPNRRGMMVSLNEVGITVGFLFAYLLNYLFITFSNGWRFMFGAALIPAFLQAVGICFMPPSHHYLIIKERKDEARKVLKQLRNTNNVDREIEAVIAAIAEQKNRKYSDLFRTSHNMRSRMALGMILVFLQQFSGHANVLYYAPTIFQYFGYKSDTLATLVTVGLGLVKVFSTAAAILFVDKIGRRFLLITGCLLMATSVLILGIIGSVNQTKISYRGCEDVPNSKPELLNVNSSKMNARSLPLNILSKIYNHIEYNLRFDELNSTDDGLDRFINFDNCSLLDKILNDNDSYTIIQNVQNNDTNFANSTLHYEIKLQEVENQIRNASDCHNSSSNAIGGFSMQRSNSSVSTTVKVLSVVSLMTFVCAYGISYGPVTWLILSEIFPSSLRGRAISVATCINWGSNIIVSLTFLNILNVLGVGVTFILYGCISYSAAIFIFFFVPETRNRSLEEITRILNKGVTVKHPCLFASKEQKYSLECTSLTLTTKAINNM